MLVLGMLKFGILLFHAGFSARKVEVKIILSKIYSIFKINLNQLFCFNILAAYGLMMADILWSLFGGMFIATAASRLQDILAQTDGK